jgi:REP element-mobilizing transposase RayT
MLSQNIGSPERATAMPRQARLDSPGTLHHVILRGIEKRDIVKNRYDRKDFVSRMGDVAIETETIIYAWALLPNHAHILLRSGAQGLPRYMRRLLTGYAIGYNRRHNRNGHLFQNRYKSIVCDEDSYFQELVRYIHLNPLRAGLVKSLAELDSYPWCGHAVIIGKMKNGWQDRDYVLSWFGRKEGQAKKEYRRFVGSGVEQGSRPDLVGGGLVRSLGGWSQVGSLRRRGERVPCDDRVLGTGDFVEGVLKEADRNLRSQMAQKANDKSPEQFIEEECKKEKIAVKELVSGSRRGQIPQMRSRIAYRLVAEFGLPMAEVARYLGISTSGICRAIQRVGSSKEASILKKRKST